MSQYNASNAMHEVNTSSRRIHLVSLHFLPISFVSPHHNVEWQHLEPVASDEQGGKPDAGDLLATIPSFPLAADKYLTWPPSLCLPAHHQM